MFYQCAEAVVCSDQNLVKRATFCSEVETLFLYTDLKVGEHVQNLMMYIK